MALTSGNVTVKLAGGTYSSWAAFWDDIGNLTGNITCTVDTSAFTETAGSGIMGESLNGHTLHVLPVSFPTKTDASDGARFTFNTINNILDMQMEGAGTVIIEGMVFIEGTSVPGYGVYLATVDAEFDFIVRRNIFKGCNYALYQGDFTVNSGTKWYNNIIYDADLYGIYVKYDVPLALIANNTLHNCNDNIDCGDEEVTLENNLSYAGINTCFINIELLTIGNNNADSDNTGEDADWGGGGANNVPGIGDPFNNLGADDFTITVEGDVGTAGKDLSGSFTDDFFGLERDDWTIGACEYYVPPEKYVSGIAAAILSAAGALSLGKIELISGIANAVFTTDGQLGLILPSSGSADAILDSAGILSLGKTELVSGIAGAILSATGLLSLGKIELVSGSADAVLEAYINLGLLMDISGLSEASLYARNHITIAGEELTHGILKGY